MLHVVSCVNSISLLRPILNQILDGLQLFLSMPVPLHDLSPYFPFRPLFLKKMIFVAVVLLFQNTVPLTHVH